MYAESSTDRNNITLTGASTKTNQIRTSLRIYITPNLPPLDTRQHTVLTLRPVIRNKQNAPSS